MEFYEICEVSEVNLPGEITYEVTTTPSFGSDSWPVKLLIDAWLLRQQ